MFTHYLSSAWRHFRQHTGTTLINVFCLTFGLVAFLLAWGMAEYQAHSDHYHEHADRTVVLTRFQPESRITFHITPWVLADQLRADFPSLDAIARVMYAQETTLAVDGRKQFASTTYADADFLRIFDLPFVHGDSRSALAQPRSVIVSETLAQRLFDSTDVIGRMLRISGAKDGAVISGVIGAIPKPSHLQTGDASAVGMNLSFDAMFSMDMNPASRATTNWEQDAYFTYAVLASGGPDAIRRFDRELKDFSVRRVPPELRNEMVFGARRAGDFIAIGMDAVVRADVTGVPSSTVIKILGALVLAIACLNYANLATALAMTRAKEVALRKVVGASRRQLLVQHVTESGLLTAICLIAALVVTATIVLAIGADTLVAAVRLFGSLGRFWSTLALTVIAVSIAASAYPALVQSRVQPAFALRGGRFNGGPRFLATILVGCQFAAASFLMIAVFTMLNHHRETRAAVWKEGTDPVLAIANDVRGAGVDLQLLSNELRRQPGIHSVSAMHRMPWTPGADSDGIAATADPAASVTQLHRTIVAPDFFETLGIPLLAGRTFDRGRAADLANIKAWYERDPVAGADYNVVIDARYLATLGASTPANAIDRILYRPTSADRSKPPQRLRIIGVVETSSFMPLTGGTAGMFLMNPDAALVPIVRVSNSDVLGAVSRIDGVWHRLSPDVPIKRRFADEQFDIGFEAFARINQALAMLALFASAIAVVGLIGMALHVTRRRLHEIGVRKSLGASVSQILSMLLRNFLKPVVIANVIVWPFVYAMMSAYLSIFANQGSLTLVPFVSSLLISLVIACIAVAAQTVHAARLRPADVLRYE